MSGGHENFFKILAVPFHLYSNIFCISGFCDSPTIERFLKPKRDLVYDNPKLSYPGLNELHILYKFFDFSTMMLNVVTIHT